MIQLNGIDVIPLATVIYNANARNGIWCCSPYPGHPHGCPNFKTGCTNITPFFMLLPERYDWYAIVQEFDLHGHAEKLKAKFPERIKNGKVVPAWTDRQCRNPIYWQGTIRKILREKCKQTKADIILEIPEARGVEVFETMKLAGIILERKPDIVRKVMMVGVLKS